MQPDSVDICPELISSEISEPLPTIHCSEHHGCYLRTLLHTNIRGQRSARPFYQNTLSLSGPASEGLTPPDDITTLSPGTCGAKLRMGAI